MPASLRLNWSSDAVNEDGFGIERKNLITGVFEEIGRVATNVLTYTDPNLLYSTKYTYKVYAYNVTGKSYSLEAFATTVVNPLPNAPTGLTVTPL